MPDDLFYQCKTATKFREYAACRIAGIYADVETYRDCVTGGVTGLLVRTLANPGNPVNPANLATGDAWVAAIGRLIRDRALRRCIQDRAYAYVRERYAPGRFEQRWLAQNALTLPRYSEVTEGAVGRDAQRE